MAFREKFMGHSFCDNLVVQERGGWKNTPELYAK